MILVPLLPPVKLLRERYSYVYSVNEGGGEKFLQNPSTIDERRRCLKFNSTNPIVFPPAHPGRGSIDASSTRVMRVKVYARTSINGVDSRRKRGEWLENRITKIPENV